MKNKSGLFKIVLFSLTIGSVSSIAFADLVRVPFLKTKYKGERVTIDVFSNNESKNYFTSSFIQGREGAGSYVRFSNNQEGIFLIDDMLVKIKHINSNLNRYTYFTNKFSPGGAYLVLPTDITVDKEGNLFAVDRSSSYIHGLKLDVTGGTYNWSGYTKKYVMDYQDHQMQYLTHVNDGVQKIVFAMNDMGHIHVLNYDLSPVQNNQNVPLVYNIQFPGAVFKKLKCDHLSENGIVTLYTATRPPDSVTGRGFLNQGWMELKYSIPQKAFINERFVECGPNRVGEFEDIQPFYIANGTGAPILHVFASDLWGSLHEFREDGQLVKTIVSGLDDNNPRKFKTNPELKNPSSLMSCNDRRNYGVCRNIVVAEDFRSPGHGLVRYQFLPNAGDEYFVPLDIQMKENCNCTNINQPFIKITNLSSVDVLSGFTVRFWMSKEENPYQELAADKYYFNPDSIALSTGVHPDNPNIVYVDLTFPQSYELLPGETTPESGTQFGAHFKGYWPGTWDRSNDWSWNGITSTYSSTKNVTVYDEQGHLIYGTPPNPNSVPQPPQLSASELFGFEKLFAWGSEQATLTLSANHTQGSTSLQVQGGGYLLMSALPMNTQDIPGATSRLGLDLYIPGNQPNPYWVGATQLLVDCFSAGIYNAYLGQVELTGLPQNHFSTVYFDVPQNLLSVLHGNYRDFTLKVVLNVNSGSAPFLIDNLRFVP